jgi:hypothetical protein
MTETFIRKVIYSNHAYEIWSSKILQKRTSYYYKVLDTKNHRHFWAQCPVYCESKEYYKTPGEAAIAAEDCIDLIESGEK